MRLGSWSKAAVGLVLVVACACAPTLAFDFLEWDDPLHVTRNPLLLERGHSLWEQFSTPALGYPIPITLASYRVEHVLFGLDPVAFHFTNSALHTANVALAFVLARVLGLGLRGALLGALFFGLHPAAAECASWITGRKDLLACFLGLSSLLLASRTFRAAQFASVLSYALGLLSKPSIAPLFLFVPCLSPHAAGSDARVEGSRWQALRRSAWKLLPYAAVLLPVTYLGVIGQSAAGASVESYAPLLRMRASWFALGHHAALVLFAEEPTVKYQYPTWPPVFPSKADVAGCLLLVWLALACYACRNAARNAARFGAAFAAFTYLPVSGVLYPLARYLADTYVYLPLVGLGLTVGAVFEQVTHRLTATLARWSRAAPWLVGLTLLPMFWTSSARFESDFALWSHALERAPHHPRICRQFTNATYKKFGAEAGLLALDRCAARFGYELLEKNRGIMLTELGRYHEARSWLERAAQRDPSDPVTQAYLRRLAPFEGEPGAQAR